MNSPDINKLNQANILLDRIETFSKENPAKSNAFILFVNGNGPVKAIHEEFRIKLSITTSELSVPIIFRRNAFTPTISLSCHSRNGNDQFDFYWDIYISSNERNYGFKRKVE